MCCIHVRHVTGTLNEVLRPTLNDDRVSPCHFREYAFTREFKGPCCLCSLLVPGGEAVYTEAAVFVSSTKPYAGLYVAQCAKGECGYFGWSCLRFQID
jgi:hypothetical protein